MTRRQGIVNVNARHLRVEEGAALVLPAYQRKGFGNMKRKAWYYRLPGSFYAFGPAMYDSPVSEREVRMMLLRTWYPNKKRLPAGVEVWSAL